MVKLTMANFQQPFILPFSSRKRANKQTNDKRTCRGGQYLKYFLYLVFGIWNTTNWVVGILVF